MFFEFKGLKIYYEKIGEGQPIIFLHGWGCSSNVFKNISKVLSKKYCIYLVDFPGFGKSLEPDFLIDVKGMADLVLSFITYFDIDMPIVVGHSYGGRVASEYASKNKNISKLILIDSAGIKSFKFSKFIKIKIFKFKKMFYKLTKNLMKYNNLLLTSGSDDYINSSMIKKKMLVAAVNYDQRKVFKRIRCDTLIIWGINDNSTPYKDGRKIHRLINNSEFVVVPDAGHFPFLENYIFFIKVLKSYLGV